MQSSMFNVRVRLEDSRDVFLMNTFTDAQLIVGPEVASLLERLERSPGEDGKPHDEQELAAVATLAEHGFVVPDRATERARLESFFEDVREDTRELRVTVLTTLQCNFACDYCIQGDHGDYNRTAAKMSVETAERVIRWTEARLDATAAPSFVLTLFGGEPLLNLPVAYLLAERLWAATQARGVRMQINVITNGLLLTPDVVDRLLPFGLNVVKVTLDGDRDAHNRMRPLRGGQGTFDRIVGNLRKIAGKCTISIGGNFDESSLASYPALLDYLAAQDFAPAIGRVAFKPVVRDVKARVAEGVGRKFVPLTAVGEAQRPLKGTCMTSAGSGSLGGTACDTCHFSSEAMATLREETTRRGFRTSDGVHMGPCEIHRRHAHTIGPDGSLYACPGFTGDARMSTGHIGGAPEDGRAAAARAFDRLSAWKECRDCAFIPVCAGGCSVASHAELGDMNKPTCHKSSFEAGVATMARDAAASLTSALSAQGL